MGELVETSAEKKERKRLKKLAKLKLKEKIAAVETGSENNEKPEKKLKRKAKDLENDVAKKIKISSEVESSATEATSLKIKIEVNKAAPKVKDEKKTKKEKKKKKKERQVENPENLVAFLQKRSKKENDEEEPLTKKIKVVLDDAVSKDEKIQKKKKKKLEQKEKKKKNSTDSSVSQETGTFKKIFYHPTEATINMSENECKEFQKEHKMNVTGRLSESYKPIKKFEDFNIDPKIMSVCKNFEKPMAIQGQCWPIISSGRDIIGIAETGSGKTLAFALPALAHMMHRIEHQPANVPWGPTMLVLAPTRELAMQSQEVLENAGKVCGIRSVCCYGGVPKWEQKRALRWGVEAVVATPGRLKDLVQMGCVNLGGVSYLVLDEADRMLDQGFEEDIRWIIGQTHPERQTCLFSATWPEAIRNLAQEFLTDPIKVTIGSDDLAANKRITQIVEVVQDDDKDDRLMKLLEKYSDAENKNRILIFTLKKRDASELETRLRNSGWWVGSIHGDKDQWSRNKALDNFKSGRTPLLVATDVAARGLDIPGVEYVINYSFPLTIEDYVHRIGRTGRAGKDGTAHSFFNYGNKINAGALVKILQDAGQEVPKDMYKFDLRIKASQYRKFFKEEGSNNPGRGNGCFKCGDGGHISRFCKQGFGGGRGGGNRGARNFGGRGGHDGGANNNGCFKCGESGHMSRECPQRGGGGGGSCYNCGESGHMSRECPKKGDKTIGHRGRSGMSRGVAAGRSFTMAV